MKFFHTADWHLGKILQGQHLTEDQRYILNQFVDIAIEERPDAIFIAGDLYDRAVPPTEAVELLDDILVRLVIKEQIPVIAISGNHDSASRLQFGTRVMKEAGCHIIGTCQFPMEPIKFHDEHGEVHIHAVPFADPATIRYQLKNDTISTYQDAMKATLDTFTLDPSARHILIGHAFVTPHGKEEPNTSESERPLSIGGAEYVSADLFENFQYVALGHLHQAHYVKNQHIRYAGSPMKYSISEEHHQKGFFIVEMNENGDVQIEKRVLTPLRDIRTVEGTLENLLQQPSDDDYVFVKLLDEGIVLHPMEQLRTVFPNILHVERNVRVTPTTTESTKSRTQLSEMELFRSFYEEVKQQEPEEEAVTLFAEALDNLRRAEREDKEWTS